MQLASRCFSEAQLQSNISDANILDVQRSELLTVEPAASCSYTPTIQSVGILYVLYTQTYIIKFAEVQRKHTGISK